VCVHFSLHVRKIADELAGSSSYYLLKVRKSVSYSYLKVLGHQRQKISETAVVTDGGVSKSRTISTVRGNRPEFNTVTAGQDCAGHVRACDQSPTKSGQCQIPLDVPDQTVACRVVSFLNSTTRTHGLCDLTRPDPQTKCHGQSPYMSRLSGQVYDQTKFSETRVVDPGLRQSLVGRD